jgi:hypothetical protein
VLIGIYDGGALGALLVATYSGRTSALALFHALPRFVRSPELPGLFVRFLPRAAPVPLPRDCTSPLVQYFSNGSSASPAPPAAA